MPQMQFISVVLPAPLTPMMPSTSPRSACRSMPSSAVSPPKRLRSPLISIAASPSFTAALSSRAARPAARGSPRRGCRSRRSAPSPAAGTPSPAARTARRAARRAARRSGLPSPPSTTTMKPMIEYSAPENGLNAGNTSATSTPVMPAIAVARPNAKADSRSTSTPMIWIASGFMIVARSALPGRVRNRNARQRAGQHQADRRTRRCARSRRRSGRPSSRSG